MRAYVLLVTLVAYALADDRSFCQKSCANKFTAEDQKTACLEGCKNRDFDQQGMFFFVACRRNCDSAYGNATTDEGAACYFACGLPKINSVFMSINFNGKGKPEIQVIKHDGPKDDSSQSDELPSNPFKEFGRNPLLDDSDDDHFESIEDRFQKMIARMRADMRQRFFDSHQSPFGANDPFDSSALASKLEDEGVGNVNEWGEPILMVHPVPNDQDFGEEIPSQWLEKRPESWYRHRHLPLLFKAAFMILSLLALICATFIFVRILKSRSERYQRVVCNPTRAANMTMVSGSHVIPLKIDQKIPFEIEPPKDGVPPPAYDQLSLGSVHKKLHQNTNE